MFLKKVYSVTAIFSILTCDSFAGLGDGGQTPPKRPRIESALLTVCESELNKLNVVNNDDDNDLNEELPHKRRNSKSNGDRKTFPKKFKLQSNDIDFRKVEPSLYSIEQIDIMISDLVEGQHTQEIQTLYCQKIIKLMSAQHFDLAEALDITESKISHSQNRKAIYCYITEQLVKHFAVLAPNVKMPPWKKLNLLKERLYFNCTRNGLSQENKRETYLNVSILSSFGVLFYGVKGFLQKPCDLSAIFADVEMTLSQRALAAYYLAISYLKRGDIDNYQIWKTHADNHKDDLPLKMLMQLESM